MNTAVIMITLILLSGCILLHATRQLLSIWLKVFLSLAVIISAMAYTGFGQLDIIFPKDQAYKEKSGNAPKHLLFHWHENYHYYLGAKYFNELGYKGLYETVALADKESTDPMLKVKAMRSLRAPTFPISIDEAVKRANNEFRPRFTEERWKSFTNDLQTFKDVGDVKWLDLGMFDAGYNPPPSWAVIGTTIANIIPISQEQAWGGDMRPEWYQLEWISLLDPIILLIALGFVAWAFGPLGATAFAIFFFLNQPASFGWIAGGYLRYTWLVELMIGLSCLKKQCYLPAGIFLGLSVTDRIFPAAFLGAAACSVLAKNIRNRHFRPIIKLSIGAGLTISIITGISILMFGMEAWQGFFEKIWTHKDLYFVNHIGYRRIAVFSPEILNQNFWWDDGLNRFREWNAHLVEKWESVRPLHWVLWAVMIASAAFASLRARADEAALMLGGLLFFLFEIAANYYYIYFPMVFVVLLTATYTSMRTILLGAFIVLWSSLWYYNYAFDEQLHNNYYKCCAFFAFFCLWIFSRAGETLIWVLREQQQNTLKNSSETP